MTLAEFLKRKNLTMTAFAEKAGLPLYTVSRAVAGRIPTAKALQKIHDATGGAVTPNDFYGIGPVRKGRAA